MSHTHFPRSARIAGAAGALVSILALIGSAAARECNLTLEMAPHGSPFAPGEMATALAKGDPGDYALFMLDVSAGPSILPLKGGIPIELPQSSSFITLFRKFDANGEAEVSCTVDCDAPEFFGVEFFVQVASFDPVSKEICTSNVVSFAWEDDGTCNPELQGCTPGYWKQGHHADSWPAPYTQDTLFSDVFDDAFPGLTLDDVLGLNGAGLEALGRHTVAALLNAHSPDVNYYITAQEVIDAFNAVYPGTDEEYEDLKDEFEPNNELGCPLN